MLAALGLSAMGGAPGGGGGMPGFDNSSSAESSAGPVTVGGLTFAPSDSATMVRGAVIIAVIFAAAIYFKGRK